MSTPIVTGPKRILRRWRNRHQLPVVQLDPAMTDADVEFASDLHYYRDLLEQIQTNHIYGRSAALAPFPTILSTTLDIALELVRGDFPDRVAAELAAWRADIAAAAA